MRWPKSIAPRTVSDEIVHAMDLFPSFATIAGGRAPKDRVIDGMDQSPLFLGKEKKSGRDGFVVYMGTKIFAVKWQNWKLHFNELESWSEDTITYEMPKVYNLYDDPGETNNVLFPNTWVPQVALPLLEEHLTSLKENPPIRAGELDPYPPLH